jgi:hypothetical protein
MTATTSAPTGSFPAALVAAGVTTSTFAYFNLTDHVEETLLDGELKARVLSSLAWNLDMRAINLARNVFFEAYRKALEDGLEEGNSIDRFNAFVTSMGEAKNAGKHTPVGFDDNSSMRRLCAVLQLRKVWHDRAAAHATRPYLPKSLELMVLDEKARQVDPNTRNKLAVRAAFVADGDTAMQEELIAKLVEKANLTLQQQHEVRRKIVKPVLDILAYAGNLCATVYDDEVQFDSLPITMQVELIESAVKSADRAVDDMGLSSRVSVDDYAIAMRDAREFKKSLKAVLAAPRFNNPNDD